MKAAIRKNAQFNGDRGVLSVNILDIGILPPCSWLKKEK
jgi:hypothetical protein